MTGQTPPAAAPLGPDDALLAAYAAGAVSPGTALLVAAHATLSPASRARLAAFEALGGAALAATPAATLAPGALAATLALLETDAPLVETDASALAGPGAAGPIPEAAPRATESGPPPRIADSGPLPRIPDSGPLPRSADSGPLPRAVAQAVGRRFADIPWRFRLPGVAEMVLEGFAPERVSLMRARPGAWLPQHGHDGEELTLVLAGAMADGGRVHRAGDIVAMGAADDHKPRIVGAEVCYCLIVRDGALRYSGTFGRALNFLGQ